MQLSPTPALELDNISKTYSYRLPFLSFAQKPKKETKVLSNASLTLECGEILTLMGPNGAGKTTLLKIISSLVLPDSGVVKIFGEEFHKIGIKMQAPLSFVLGDERSFYWRLTGRQNLEFFGVMQEIPSGQLKRKIAEAVNLFEIEDPDKRYETYSTGQKGRLALARGYLSGGRLVLMDEPTRSLDHSSKTKLHELIKNLNAERGTTFLIVTHDIHEAEVLGSCFGFLNAGSLTTTRSFWDFKEQLDMMATYP